MNKNNNKILLVDSTFISNATLEIDHDYISQDDMRAYFYLTDETKIWLNLLPKMNEMLNTQTIVTEEVMVEAGMIKSDGDRLIDKSILKRNEEFGSRIYFFDMLVKERLDNVDYAISDNQEFESAIRGFDRAKHGIRTYGKWDIAAQLNIFSFCFKGKQFGDKSIINLIENQPKNDFFVITSDHRLGLEVNAHDNAKAMNFAGLYTSLRDFGVLKRLGFAEDAPNGNVFDETLSAKNDGWRRNVITRREFEDYLQHDLGYERIKDKGTTITSEYRLITFGDKSPF